MVKMYFENYSHVKTAVKRSLTEKDWQSHTHKCCEIATTTHIPIVAVCHYMILEVGATEELVEQFNRMVDFYNYEVDKK